MIYEYKFIIALFTSIAIEVPIVFLLMYYVYKYRKQPKGNIICVAFFATALTLPYLWFVLPVFISSRIYYMIIGEISVFIVEAIFYLLLFKIKKSHAFILSFISNLVSFLVGILLF